MSHSHCLNMESLIQYLHVAIKGDRFLPPSPVRFVMGVWCIAQLSDICLSAEVWWCGHGSDLTLGLCLGSSLESPMSQKPPQCLGLAACRIRLVVPALLQCLLTGGRICGPRALHRSNYCNWEVVRALCSGRVVRSRISLTVELVKLLNAATCTCK